jgi:integrase
MTQDLRLLVRRQDLPAVGAVGDQARLGAEAALLAETSLLLGLRPGEGLGLAWDDVDFAAGTLRIRQAVRREGGRTFLGEPKTARSRRTLDMPTPVIEALRAHRASQAAERLVVGPAWTDSGLVFTTEVGTLLDPSNVRHRFSRLTAKAGLGPRRLHELRHSAVSLLSAAGVRLEEVADVVGHASTRMTGDVYRHRVETSVAAAKAPMEAMFRSSNECWLPLAPCARTVLYATRLPAL